MAAPPFQFSLSPFTPLSPSAMYRPDCLSPFSADLADSLLEQALESVGLAKDRLANLTDDEKRRLDEATWRLVTAADVSDKPCGD